MNQAPTNAPADHGPGLRREVGRWQIVALSINDVIGSGIYLLPAAAAALLAGASIWAILLAGFAVALIVLCYAAAASHFDKPGGAYLYARTAFGPFIGFQAGWMSSLTRISSIAALSNGLALAISHFWPAAASGLAHTTIIAASLLVLAWINLIGVRAAARTGTALTIAKVLPLLFFIGYGIWFVDWSLAKPTALPEIDTTNLAKAALLLLFAYAGFENTPAAAGEYRNPRRDVPFALLTMIALVTAIYVLVQFVAQGTLPNLAATNTPLAEAAALFGGQAAAMLLTVGASVSILGTIFNSTLFGPRYLYAMAVDGFLPAVFARLHPRWRTPAFAILVQTAVALAMALSGSFVQLALLSVIARLFAYLVTAASVIVLSRRETRREGTLRLPGGALVPVAAILLSLGLLASASLANLAAGAVALLVGSLIYAFRRKPDAP